MPFVDDVRCSGIMVGVIEHFDEAWNELTAAGGPFAMTEIEVRGHPMRVFDSAPPTMRSLWELAALHGDKTYVVYEDERYTYAEIDAQVRALAALLRNEHGVGSGDRVAIAMRNYPEWVVGYWATVSIGAAVVGMNAWWTTQEMEFGLGDSRPKVLIADDERLERVLPVLDTLARRRATPPDRRPQRPRAARRRDPVVRRGRPRQRTRLAPDGRHRPRRRRHDLLHVGDDRVPEGRSAHAPRLGAQRDEHRVHVDGVGDGGGKGQRPRPVPRRTPPTRRQPHRRCSWPRRRCST